MEIASDANCSLRCAVFIPFLMDSFHFIFYFTFFVLYIITAGKIVFIEIYQIASSHCHIIFAEITATKKWRKIEMRQLASQ
jgi:hypothetical protein